MSLLRHLTPALRATRRPCVAALSTTVAPPHSGEVDYLAARQETLFPPTDTGDSEPPKAPFTAYPPPSPPNPITEARQPGALDAVRSQPPYALYVKATSTNTIVTLTMPNGNPIRTLTGGHRDVGFKGGNRSGYEAGYKCAVEIFKTLKKSMDDTANKRWELYLNGYGNGREAVHKALMAGEGREVRPLLRRITDKTPIKIGGTRAKKQKRR